MFASIAAVGAGLQVAADFLEGAAELGTVATASTTVVPVAIYVFALYGIGSVSIRQRDPFHLLLLAVTAGLLALAVVFAAMGASAPWCLLVLTFGR